MNKFEKPSIEIIVLDEEEILLASGELDAGAYPWEPKEIEG